MAEGLTIDAISIEVGYQSNNASTGVDKLAQSLKKLKSAISGIGLEKVSSELNKMNTAVATFPLGKLQKIADAMARVKGSNGLGGVSSAVSGTTMPTAPATVEATPVTDTIAEQTKEIEQATGAVKAYSEETQKSTKSTDKLSKSVKKSTTAFGSFLKSIGRIALYRVIRSAIKAVTQAFSEGVKNVALYSKAIGEVDSTSANPILSQYASMFLKLKNSIGAAVIPLLQAFLPAIQQITNALIRCFEVFNMLINSLLGNGFYYKAKDYAVDFAENLDSASGSAKELKKQLMGFDELNVINNNNSGSGSGSNYNYEDMFERVEIDTDWLKNKIDTLGTTIGVFINWCIMKVNWLVDQIKNIDWVGLGSKIVDWIVQGVKEIDWKTLAEDTNFLSLLPIFLPAKLATGILVGILKNIFTESINRIKTAVEESGGNVGKAILKGIWGVFRDIGVWIWTNVIKPFIDAFWELWGLSDVIDTFRKSGKIIVDCLKDGIGVIWDKIKIKFNDFADKAGVFFADLTVNALNWGANIIASVINGVGDIWAKIRFTFDAFTTKVELFFFNAKEKAKEFGENFVEAIKHPFSTLGTAIKSGLNDMIAKIESAINSIADRLNGKTFSLFGKDYTVNLQRVSIPRLASGGVVNAGQMFIANEAGPELVGNVGRKTAVMNSSQIVDAVSVGVANAVARSMGGTAQPVNVNVDGDTLFSFVVKKNNQQVYSTGASPLLV